ncbi:MAG: HAD family phosphatase [Alphaproteobacteria bacterium]|nr:HAD family phosphatase [Alphaproteobacteria bacterium]
MPRALIYDFDGIIADSEMLVNGAMAEGVTRLGLPMTAEESIATYLGMRWPEVVARTKVLLAERGLAPPNDFGDGLKANIHRRFKDELREVPGARAAIRHFAPVPHAIASSSAADRLALCLEALELAEDFGAHVYSADLVTNGKPAPDIFLLAAARLNARPADCIVIEDSPGGIRAARAAGMTAIGLHAAGHLPTGHEEKLRDAGAHRIARDWDAARAIIASLL